MGKVSSMLVALCILLSIIVISFFENKIKFKNKKRILFVFTIIISLYYAFRDIGLDLESYRIMYTDTYIVINKYFIKNMFQYNIEPFFVLEIFILKNLGIGFKGFLFINAFIPLLIIYKIIIRKDNNILVTYCLFVLINFFKLDVIRHFFAATLYIYALYNYNSLKGIIISASTTFFHYSNLLTLVVWSFLKKKVITKGTLVIIIVSTILFSLVLKRSINSIFLIEIVSSIKWLEGTSILNKIIYYFYYNTTYYNYSGNLHKGLLIVMNYYTPVIALIIIILQKEKQDFEHLILINSQKLSLIFLVFFTIMGATTLGTRVDFVLGIGLFLILKNYISESKSFVQIYMLSIFFLIIYNFVIVLYYIGVQNPNSMFYLGF